jgi:hypothetical protein
MKENRLCLTESQIGGYIEGRLPELDREAVEGHLNICPLCRNAAEVAKSLLAAGPPSKETVPEYMIQKAVDYYEEKETIFDIILRLMEETVRVIRSAADVALAIPQPLGALRGVQALSPTMVVLTKSFRSADVECDIERVASGRCNIKVVVMDPKRGSPLRNLRVELFCRDRQLASSSTEKGDVLFEDVSKERYSIKVLQKGEILGELTLKIE